MVHSFVKTISVSALGLVAISYSSVVHAQTQIGILTSAIGQGSVTHEIGDSSPWEIGSSIEEGDDIRTEADSFAMIFFVAGLGAADIDFEGTIVVEIDQLSEVKIKRGAGMRAPIDIHVTKGRARAYFDAGRHKDYILLSTPRGALQVTGSVIYAAHSEAEGGTSEFGSFDSECKLDVYGAKGAILSQLQKAVISEAGVDIVSMTGADLKSWNDLPDLNLASAFSSRGDVRVSYAGRTWVGEYVTGAERLEDVANEQNANIPSQTPELVSTSAATITRNTTSTPRQTQPTLRAASSGRTVGDDDTGVGRNTQRLPSQR